MLRQFADGGTDPHAWLNPDNARAWAAAIAEALAKADPEHAVTYRANAARTEATLAALDRELAAALAPAQGKPLVVFHDALGYFADHYRLNIVAAIELGDAAPPSAAQLAEVQAVLHAHPTACLFPEAGRDDAYLETVAEGTDARIGRAQDPEGIDLAPGPELYATLLRNLAKTITECLAG